MITPEQQRLLIVEDEPAIRSGLEDVFVYHGYQVESAEEGRHGLQLALSGRFDLVLLDVMLPGMDGFEICDRIRSQDPEQPIIMLTARTAEEDIIEGLRLGADDYVPKPFSVTQLVLRVQAVLRRSGSPRSELETLCFGGDVEVDLLNLCGRNGGTTTRFTRREVQLLRYLAGNPERPVGRDELLNKVWGYALNSGIETRTVDIHIAKLRRKIEPEPGEPRNLVTVRGAGYRLMVE